MAVKCKTNRNALRRIAFLLISVTYWAATSLVQQFRRLLRQESPAKCCVLYYHSIKNHETPTFARQLDELRRLGTPVSLRDGQLLKPGRYYFAITFDDGFTSILENAIPELLARAIPCTLFVPSGYLNRVPGWNLGDLKIDDEVVASPERLLSLHSDLVDIGSHTVTHPNLRVVDPEVADRELRESRRQLEKLLGRKVTLFAFPYGSHSPGLVRMAHDAGYQRVFITEPRNTCLDPRERVIGRIHIAPDDWWWEFRLKIRGAYAWIPRACRFRDWINNRFALIAASIRSIQRDGIAERTG